MKPRKKKGPSSLLNRLFGGNKKGKGKKSASKKGKKGSKAGKKSAGETPEKARPLTRLERSISEIKQMTKIGERDPERLAQLLAAMLAKEREQQQIDQERFEQQVWDIIHRDEQEKVEDEDSPPGGDPALN